MHELVLGYIRPIATTILDDQRHLAVMSLVGLDTIPLTSLTVDNDIVVTQLLDAREIVRNFLEDQNQVVLAGLIGTDVVFVAVLDADIDGIPTRLSLLRVVAGAVLDADIDQSLPVLPGTPRIVGAVLYAETEHLSTFLLGDGNTIVPTVLVGHLKDLLAVQTAVEGISGRTVAQVVLHDLRPGVVMLDDADEIAGTGLLAIGVVSRLSRQCHKNGRR